MSDTPDPIKVSLTKMQHVKAVADSLAKIIGALLVALVILDLTVLIIRQQNNASNSNDKLTDIQSILKTVQGNAKDTKTVVTFLVDCTTSGHACYDNATKSGKSRSTEIENVISATIIATATCRAAHEDQSFTILKACVDKYVN